MSIICSPKKPNPSLESLITQKKNRDLGLSSVFNVNTDIVSCIERYESPEYTISGSCKPVSGLTIGCPNGYEINGCNDKCLQVSSTGVTANINSGTTMVALTGNVTYGSLGAYFYESIQNRPLPIYRTGSTTTNPFHDATGGLITTTNIVSGDTFWDSGGLTTQGRLNLTGWFDSLPEYNGVSYCFNVSGCSETYYIGFGFGSLYARITIDGVLVVNLTDTSSIGNRYQWNVIPWTFSEGKHIIEAEGFRNRDGAAIEVYKPINGLSQLLTATTSGETGVVFTSATKIGQQYDLGQTVGYKCPNGYSMDTCGTGLTCTLLDYVDTIQVTPECYYNLSEIEEINLLFNLTGSTQYTGYTGQLCYTLNNTLPAANFTPVCTQYSGITGTTLVKNLGLSDLSRVDNEYILKTWNIFESKCQEGLIIDTSDYLPANTDNDYYFITTINPPKPILQQIPNNVFEGLTFINDTIFPTTNGSNTFLLNNTPIGNTVVLSVNGITVAQNDYTFNVTNSRLITFRSNIVLDNRDVVQAYYNTSSNIDTNSVLGVNSPVKLEMFSVTGITTGVTSNFSATTYNNIVNYNIDSNRIEVFLNEKMDPSIQPIITINGVNVVYNYDVFKSNIVHNKLVFAEGMDIRIGDVISVYYYYSGFNNVGDLGQLRTDRPTINWSTQFNVIPNTVGSYGSFTVEVAYATDTTFSNPVISDVTVYNNGLSTYSLLISPITTTSVKNYIYRVKFTKGYGTQVVPNIYTTESISNVGSFSLNWAYILNTKY